MNRKTIAYWVSTILFCLVLGFSGATHVLRVEFMVANMAALGYPAYFMTIIGTFKLLGVAVLLVPGLPRLKEWAYAGFTFNLLGAAASHFGAGESIDHWIRPLIVLGVGAASYLLRPRSRRITEAVSFGGAHRGDSAKLAGPLPNSQG